MDVPRRREMTIIQDLGEIPTSRFRCRLWLRAVVAGGLLAIGLVPPSRASAQVAPAADAGGYKISAGGTASGFYVQYGERKLLGYSAFVDADAHRGIGLEAEGRWLEYHQTADVHVETYSLGVRYHMNFRRFQPYAKGLIGFGDFNFPYNYATGRYLLVTAGGGLDYRLSRRIHLRVADVEYQMWPQFTFGNMSTVGVSTGLRVGIF
jgi:hypothetical protein